MTRKAPSRESLQAECDVFNFDCRVGGRVAVKIDGTDKPLITTTRTEAQILSGHTAVVWLDGVSGCYCLSHVTPIPVEDDAWAVLAPNGNVIYWDRDRAKVSDVARQHRLSYGPYMPRVPRSAWTMKPPVEQGEYWHWNGDPDSAPSVIHVLYSGTARKGFVPMNHSHTGHAIMCDEYGGYWLRLSTPELPEIHQ